MAAMHSLPETFGFAGVAALVAWRVYARIRRMVGRQRLSRYRAPITLGIYALLLVLVALPSLSHPERLWWLPAGLACGVALGVFGLRHTRFEAVRGEGFFYTPNAHLGIGLSLLFVARIAYRIYEVYAGDLAAPHGTVGFAQSPLTLAVFGLLAGYYISYAAGLLRWRARVLRAKRANDKQARDRQAHDKREREQQAT